MKKDLGNLWQPQGDIKLFKGKGIPIAAIRVTTAESVFLKFFRYPKKSESLFLKGQMPQVSATKQEKKE